MLAGWYSFDVIDLVSFTVIYIFVYFIVWIVFMLINKRYISEINAKLNK